MPASVQIVRGTLGDERERPYSPRGGALDLFRAREREVLLCGPAGTGKSRAALEKLNLVCMQQPVRCAMVRKTRASLTQSAMTTFEDKVLPRPSSVRFHETDQEYRYPSGAKIIVGGLDNPDKIGSTEFDLIYVQEATELEPDDWGMLLRGLRNNRLSYQQLLADCNPSYPQHWLKKRCDVGTTRLIASRHEDNPLLFNDDQPTEFGSAYLQTLDGLEGYQYQRLRLGLWVSAEGMYFSEWDPHIHVCPPFTIPDHWPRWLSVDYGFAAPFCALWYARDPDSRHIYLYREVYRPGLRDEQQAELLLEYSENEQILLSVLDPSMFNPRTESQRPSIAKVYWEHGVPNIAPGMNNRHQGWALVRRALAHDSGPPRLQVLEGAAPNLLREIPTLVRDPLDPEDVADLVNGKKIDDHAADSLRYGLCAEAQPPPPARASARWG